MSIQLAIGRAYAWSRFKKPLETSPWSSSMLTAFGATGAHPDSGSIAKAFAIHGVGYAVFMSLGWLLIRIPAEGWKPAGWQAPPHPVGGLISAGDVAARNAIRTPQFWLLWGAPDDSCGVEGAGLGCGF